MEHSLLVAFLDGMTYPEELSREIKQEVEACEAGLRSPANVGYIFITDGPQTMVTRDHMKRLLQCLLDETIPWMAANYIGDCLMMSDDFHPLDEAVSEAIEFVADDSRPPTRDEIRVAIQTMY